MSNKNAFSHCSKNECGTYKPNIEQQYNLSQPTGLSAYLRGAFSTLLHPIHSLCCTAWDRMTKVPWWTKKKHNPVSHANKMYNIWALFLPILHHSTSLEDKLLSPWCNFQPAYKFSQTRKTIPGVPHKAPPSSIENKYSYMHTYTPWKVHVGQIN